MARSQENSDRNQWFRHILKAFDATKSVVSGAVIGVVLCLGGAVNAETPAPRGADFGGTPVVDRALAEWLERAQGATSRRSYVGTFVVSSVGGGLFSSRVWHVCDGSQQFERVEALTGMPRSSIRRNDEVVTFLPTVGVARVEKRETVGMFPQLNQVGDANPGERYELKPIAMDRSAGFESDVVQIVPRDRLRFGYRIWSERKTGLVIKMQTLDLDGRVIEQSAFSELLLDAPVKIERLSQMMNQLDGYKVERPDVARTSVAAEGWQLRNPVPGFKPVQCFRHGAKDARAAAGGPLQCVFSDGLASVSLFIENFDRRRHLNEVLSSMGATQTLTRRLNDGGADWWVTAMGEVPSATLVAFAQSLERRK